MKEEREDAKMSKRLMFFRWVTEHIKGICLLLAFILWMCFLIGMKTMDLSKLSTMVWLVGINIFAGFFACFGIYAKTGIEKKST